MSMGTAALLAADVQGWCFVRHPFLLVPAAAASPHLLKAAPSAVKPPINPVIL